MPDFVPGFGNRKARIVIVGEAPAREEMKEGKPFVGRSGKELTALLKSAGIDRESVYLTNASLRPVQGDKEKWFFEKDGRPTQPFLQGLAALQMDLNEIRPHVVVPVGNYALWALMQHQGIQKWRGSILWSNLFNVKVVPTLHPAALLHGSEQDGEFSGLYQYRPVVIWDLERVQEQSAFPELRLRPRKLLVNPAGVERRIAIDRLREAKRLTFDVETYGGLRLACCGFGDGDPEWAVTFAYDGERENLELFRSLLETDTPKVGQNLMYDVTLFDQLGVHPRNIDWDTMIAQHTLLPDLPKGLDFTTSVHTDIPYYKDEGKVWKFAEDSEAKRYQFFAYNAKDICATTEIAEQQKLLYDEDPDQYEVFRREMLIFDPLRGSTYNGAACDKEMLKAKIRETNAKRLFYQNLLNQEAGYEINAKSTPQVKRLLYEERGLPPRYRGGKLSTRQDVLMDLAAKTLDKAAVMVVQVREMRTLLERYYKESILSPDGRIRWTFNIGGTKTKRLSCEEPLWGPGLQTQNMPAPSRKMLRPDPGWEFGEFDQVQAEAVVTAYLAEDPIFMDCARTGKDMHRVMACLMLGQPIEMWETIGKKSIIRQQAKRCNHAFDYDMGHVTYMYVVNGEWDPEDPNSLRIDEKEASRQRNQYMELRPALPNYWAGIRAELSKTRTLFNCLGWKRLFLGAWGDAMFKDGYSWKPQSTVGMSTNMGIIRVLQHPVIRKWGVRLVFQTHDAATYTWPKEAREEVVPIILRNMEIPLYINGHYVVVPIEGAVGNHWYKDDKDDPFIGVGQSRKTAETSAEEFMEMQDEVRAAMKVDWRILSPQFAS